MSYRDNPRRGFTIATITHLPPTKAATGLSLLYAGGTRPELPAVERLLDAPAFGVAAEIIRRDADAGRLEILGNGLAFDLTGLAPAAAEQAPEARHVFGLPDRPDVFAFEALRLAPGEHIAAGAAMLPLVRVKIALALGFSRLPGLRAVCWHPAASWMDAGYFARVMQAWLAGGLFPALGLAGMVQEGGAVRSQGLHFFTGQEVHVDGLPQEAPADTVKLAVRLADRLVRDGTIDGPRAFAGHDDEPLRLELAEGGRVVRLRRS